MNEMRKMLQAVAIGSADLSGVVTSSKGPEAGVWVIAETTDLPIKFAKVAEGKRFLIDTTGSLGASSDPLLTVVTNWQAGLKK